MVARNRLGFYCADRNWLVFCAGVEVDLVFVSVVEG